MTIKYVGFVYVAYSTSHIFSLNKALTQLCVANMSPNAFNALGLAFCIGPHIKFFRLKVLLTASEKQTLPSICVDSNHIILRIGSVVSFCPFGVIDPEAHVLKFPKLLSIKGSYQSKQSPSLFEVGA